MCLKLYIIQVSVDSLYFNVYFCVCHLLRIFTIEEPGGKRNDVWKNFFPAKVSPLRLSWSQSRIWVWLQLYASVPQLFGHNPFWDEERSIWRNVANWRVQYSIGNNSKSLRVCVSLEQIKLSQISEFIFNLKCLFGSKNLFLIKEKHFLEGWNIFSDWRRECLIS